MRFAAVDLPEANDLTVGIMALVAQQEREAISRRTKEALAVAKARGVRLGNPNGVEALRRAGKGGAPLRAAIARNAERHARDLAPVVEDIRARRRDQPPGDRGGAERPRHADPPRRALARLDGDEPARPARAAGGGMRQSRLMSLVEAMANVVVGYGVAVVTQMLVFPLFGLGATLRQSLGIGAIFTLVSLVRGYLLRRAFEAVFALSAGEPLTGPKRAVSARLQKPLIQSKRFSSSIMSRSGMPVGIGLGDLRLQPTKAVDGAQVERFESIAVALVEAEGAQIAVPGGNDEPDDTHGTGLRLRSSEKRTPDPSTLNAAGDCHDPEQVGLVRPSDRSGEGAVKQRDGAWEFGHLEDAGHVVDQCPSPMTERERVYCRPGHGADLRGFRSRAYAEIRIRAMERTTVLSWRKARHSLWCAARSGGPLSALETHAGLCGRAWGKVRAARRSPTATLIAFLTGIAMKLRWFGPN